MLNRYLIIGIILMSSELSAQVEITADNYINANTVLYLESAGPGWLGSQELTQQTGEDQSWDATSWTSLLPFVQEYYPLDQTPVAYQLFFGNDFVYPEHFSTHALGADLENNDQLPLEVDDPYAFYRTDETGYYNTGNAFSIEGFPLITQNDSIERILRFPLNFGDTDQSGIGFLTQIPLLGAYGQSGTRTSEVDGWGELITPYGTYEVLRVRSELALTDTLYIEQSETGQSIDRPLEIQYSWYSPNIPGPVLAISEVQGIATSATMFNEVGVLSVVEGPMAESSLVYPNPSNGVLSIKSEIKWETVEIRDFSGKTLEVLRNEKTRELDLSNLPGGIYFISFRTEENTFSQRIILY